MANLDFYHGYGQNLDHLTTVIYKKNYDHAYGMVENFDHMTMSRYSRTERRLDGQKSVVVLPLLNLEQYFQQYSQQYFQQYF